MSNLSLLRKALGSNFISRSATANHRLPLFFRQSPSFFSTEGEQLPPESPADSFLDTSNTKGLVYGKLYGITRNTLKTDVVNLLEGCNLSLDDLKVEYNRMFKPISMMIQFPSRLAFEHAFGMIRRKGRLHRMDQVDRSQWDLLSPYNGKTVLLQGIPRNAMVEDVEHFLSGCDYDGTSINIFVRSSFPDPIKMATVLFPSSTQAMHAFLTKNRGFCLNNRISMQVLQ